MSQDTVEDEELRNLWQQAALTSRSDYRWSSDPVVQGSRRADSLRSMIYQLKFASDSGRISNNSFLDMTQQYLNTYSLVVDDFKGLNNFSDEALEFSRFKGYVNESKKWVSSLETTNLEDQIGVEAEQPSDEDLQSLICCFQQCIVPTIKTTKGKHFLYPNNNVCGISSKSSMNTACGFSTNASPAQNPFQQNSINQNTFQTTFQTRNRFSGVNDKAQDVEVSRTAIKRKLGSNGEPSKPVLPSFKTAKEKLILDDYQKHGDKGSGSIRKTLGARQSVNSGFISPFAKKEASIEITNTVSEPIITDELLKNIDPKMVELMINEIMDHGPRITWDDIAGLEFAKATIQEIVIWPMLRPDLFTGLRGPPKGILLFGPPGTGKTLIGKCIASQSKSTFFCISASSLTSKWVGEGEKLVRALFAVARCNQPAVIFIDEIDSLLTHRSDNEHESSRRIKTEFLVQLDGVATASDERLLIVGATNRPQELDEAARRRLVKRLYIPLPDEKARRQIIMTLVRDQSHSLADDQLELICKETDGYSGADMANLCKEAALGPIRDLKFVDIEKVMLDQVRSINVRDFVNALKQVRASVSDKDLEGYQDWNKKYGSGHF